MDNTIFDNIGLLAWYKDDIDTIIDCDKIGNEFIARKHREKASMELNSKEETLLTVNLH